MTTRAREVLADCEHALTDFSASVNTPFQCTRWVALITVLRTVGHVLDKVDCRDASSELQSRIKAAWQRLQGEQRPHIFHDFIDAERNDTLKQYDLGAAANPKIHGAWTLKGASLYVSHRPGAVTTSAFSMRDGPYKGRDPRQLARDAIEFWRSYLDAIDSGATS